MMEDPTLDPGTEVTQKAATNGSRWVTYKIVSKNGTVIEKTEDHAKTYKGHAAVIRRNTGTVKVSPDETTAVESTSAAAVDGMPDGYVPGESVAPESSAAATTAAVLPAHRRQRRPPVALRQRAHTVRQRLHRRQRQRLRQR